MEIDLVTKDDLEKFKRELLEELREMHFKAVLTSGAQKSWLKGIDVRKLLGISTGTLQNMRLNGTLPFSKIGGLIYYKYEDIVKLLEQKE